MPTMTTELFEDLRRQSEGETLDFKGEQYKFHKKFGEDVRGELLKDIFAFANTRRDRDACILVGVAKSPGQPGTPAGIDPQKRPEDHIDDAQVQEFVNKKVDKAVAFLYEEFSHQGKTIGVFRIFPRNIDAEGFCYLEQDYGKWRRHVLYVRRGSSTAQVEPNEVYKLGQQSVVRPAPLLKAGLLDPSTGQDLGAKIAFETTWLRVPAKIPDLRTPVCGEMLDRFPQLANFSMPTINEAFLRELAKYLAWKHAYRALRIRVTNQGAGHAKGVRLKLGTQDPDVRFMDEEDVPQLPSERKDPLGYINRVVSGVGPSRPADLVITGMRDGYALATGTFDIQPGLSVDLGWRLCIAARASKVVRLEGKLYGNEVQEPIPVAFELDFRVSERTVSIEDMRADYEVEDKAREELNKKILHARQPGF